MSKNLAARVLARVVCCLLLACVLSPCPARGQDSDLWHSISEGLRQNLAIKRQELSRIQQELPQAREGLTDALATISSRLDQLMLLRGVAGETPWASRSLLMQLDELSRAVDMAGQPLADMRDVLARAKREYATLRQVRAQNASREYAALISEELDGPGHAYKALKHEVDGVKATVDAALAQTAALQADIAAARKDEVQRFIDVFTETYFASSGSLLRLANLTAVGDDLWEWGDGAPRFWMPVLAWTSWSRYLLVAAVDFALAGLLLWLCARRWPGLGGLRLGDLLWLAAGLALFCSRHTVLFASNQFTSILWVLVLCRGVVGLLGAGRSLWTMYVCFAVTALFAVTNVPASVEGALLPLLAVAAIWRLRRHVSRWSVDIVVLAGAGVAGILGFGPQGTVAIQALFMLHLALRLNEAVQRGLATVANDRRHSLAALVAPLATTILATLYVAWVLVFLGGPGLLDRVFDLTLRVGQVSLSLKAVSWLLVSFFLLRLVQGWFTRLIGLASLRGRPMDPALAHSVGAVFSYVTWVLFLLFALHLFQVPLGALTWIASGLSVGIGFGLKDIVNNFVSGLIIMFGGAVKKGDIIQQGKNIGEVVDLSVRNTIMRTLDNTTVIIPNSSFLRGEIINLSYQDATLRLTLPVTVAPGSKIKKVRKLLLAIAKNHPDVLGKPAPQVLLRAFGRLGLEFDLYVWIDNFMKKFQVQSELALAIDQQFQDNKIALAFQGVKVKYKPKGTEAMQLEAMREEMRRKRSDVFGLTRRLRRVHARRRWPVSPKAQGGEQ